jgi:LuxR family maltose regulon positive regulatory protein
VLEAQGDLTGALGELDEGERRFVPSPDPDVRPIAALRARLWVQQGRLEEALAWAQESGVAVDDVLAYMLEFEHITLAHVLLARSRRDRDTRALAEATTLLARLERAAETGGSVSSLIEVLALEALAHEARGNRKAALSTLARALTLAEPERFARVFLDEGAPMHALLSAAATRGIAPAYVARLLAGAAPAVDSGAAPTAAAALVEPLSPRELEVLQRIAQGLSNREISERLFVAESTVKGHNRIIFDKLQVWRRTAAVARARALGLV